MSAIYIKEQGAVVGKRSERILVTKEKEKLLEIPTADVDSVAVFGNIQISTQALQMLMGQGIDISYFTVSGNYIGHMLSEKSKNIPLRLAQYESYSNESKRIEQARIIVACKVKNQMELIRRYRFSDGYEWKKVVDTMQQLISTLPERKNLNEILGIEGSCSRLWFEAYAHMFKSRIPFTGRNRRPPKDPVNVLLSLGYTFLVRDICAMLEAEGFEMYLGNLHGVRYGRKSLALDFVEAYRQPIIDRMVCYFFNKGSFTEYDFCYEEDEILLNKDSFGKFCELYEKKLQSPEFAKGEISYREILKKEIGCLKKNMVAGELYVPYRLETGKTTERR